MNTIELQRTLPAVFAGRDSIISDVWHQLLTLQRGEAYLVEAASGTGKSSLCSYIYGYRNDYQGIICFGEKNIRSLSVHDWVEIRKRSISMLFQELRLFTELTTWENVQLKNSLTGFKSGQRILQLHILPRCQLREQTQFLKQHADGTFPNLHPVMHRKTTDVFLAKTNDTLIVVTISVYVAAKR